MQIHPQIQLKEKGISEGWGGESFRGRYQPNLLISTPTLQSNLPGTKLCYNENVNGQGWWNNLTIETCKKSCLWWMIFTISIYLWTGELGMFARIKLYPKMH